MYISYVSNAVVSCRLKGIYSRMKREVSDLDHQRVCALINYTIREFQKSEQGEYENPELVAHVVQVLYTVLIDLAMKRRSHAHDKLRDTFYMIEALYHEQ